MRLESLRQPIALVRGHILWSRYVIIVTDETKSNVTLLMTKLASSTDWSRRRLIAYWVITVLIATECLVGGMMGALRLPPFIGIMEHLGYAAYFMTIIGVLVYAGRGVSARPAFSPAQGIGLCRPCL
jgi:hypothetical protein